MKILHIDDNPSITKVFSKILTLKNHDYEVCSDGKTGLELLKNGNFDLAFLDLTMPNFSGYDVLDGLKSAGASTKNIFILTATNLSEQERAKLESYGIKKILQKPITLPQVMECVNSVKGDSVTVTT